MMIFNKYYWQGLKFDVYRWYGKTFKKTLVVGKQTYDSEYYQKLSVAGGNSIKFPITYRCRMSNKSNIKHIGFIPMD